jgi:hypothetical protein
MAFVQDRCGTCEDGRSISDEDRDVVLDTSQQLFIRFSSMSTSKIPLAKSKT